ncbi:MAG: hypothetical protein K2X39_10030, partial [Silvanigrellaceae bacterium]|nr:hypothetical protein [Silvanigrellaceae bacterium]
MSVTKKKETFSDFKKTNNFLEKFTEKYLDILEKSNYFSKERFKKFCQSIPDPNSQFFIRITAILAIVTVFVLSISCVHPSAKNPNSPFKNSRAKPILPKSSSSFIEQPSFSARESPQYYRSKETEQLFLKRDQMRIEQREEGSTTGSIWADSPQPHSYFAEARPSRLGETVNVII